MADAGQVVLDRANAGQEDNNTWGGWLKNWANGLTTSSHGKTYTLVDWFHAVYEHLGNATGGVKIDLWGIFTEF